MTLISEPSRIFQEFAEDVDRIRHLLELIKEFRIFGGSAAPQQVLDSSLLWPESVALMKTSKEVRTDLPILSGSLLLYLVGRFEYFIRQVLLVSVEYITNCASKYEELPDVIRKELRARTLEVAQSPSRYGYREDRTDLLLESLVHNSNGTTNPPSIMAEVLTITESNMKSRIVADLMKRIGLTDFWKDLSKQSKIKILLEARTDQDACVKLQSKLDRLIEDRNQIAHPTSTTTFPDLDNVLLDSDFLLLLAEEVSNLACVYLTRFRPGDSNHQCS